MIITFLEHSITFYPLTWTLFTVNEGSVISTLRRYDPVLFPHLSRLTTSLLFISDYTRSLPSVSRWGEDYNELIYPQRLSSFFLVFVISHLHNAASLDRDIGGALVFKLRWTNRRWIFHGWPVALQTGQHIKAASCFFWISSRTVGPLLIISTSYSLEGENPWLWFLFFFINTGVGIDLCLCCRGSVFT